MVSKLKSAYTLITSIFIICCLVVAAFAGYAIYGRITNANLANLADLVDLEAVIEVTTRARLDSELLEASVREIAELSTLSLRYTEVGFFQDQAQVEILGWGINLPGTARSFILRFSGDIRFGIDANVIRIRVTERMSADGYDFSEIFVYMPSAVILTHAIDLSSIELLNEQTGIFVQFELDDYTGFIAERQQYIEGRDSTARLLEEARLNAEKAMYALLRAALGEAEYPIRFITL